ncbi:MAG TPA: hypothetical protein VLK89_01030 [Solirubrobacterales bacterium]|nr:hypothetical protein [Solirubrobacterales bacterium]
MGVLNELDKFFFGRRRRLDEEAWNTWHALVAMRPATMPPEWGRTLVAGYVVRVYQRAHRGTKALVSFGDFVGVQDTWWPGTCPQVGSWITAYVHLWRPPGTHSDEPVLWVDSWESQWPASAQRRALRHQARMEKASRRAPSQAKPT